VAQKSSDEVETTKEEIPKMDARAL